MENKTQVSDLSSEEHDLYLQFLEFNKTCKEPAKMTIEDHSLIVNMIRFFAPRLANEKEHKDAFRG